MSKDKSLTPRKEHALVKSQHTGALIDKHLSLLLRNEETHRDDIIHWQDCPNTDESWAYVGGTKDGLPEGRGTMFIEGVIESTKDDFLAEICGEWTQGKLSGLALVNQCSDADDRWRNCTFIGRLKGVQPSSLWSLVSRSNYDLYVDFAGMEYGNSEIDEVDLTLGPVAEEGPHVWYSFSPDEEKEKRLFNPYWTLGPPEPGGRPVLRNGTVICDEGGWDVERDKGDEILEEYLERKGEKKILWPDPSVSESWIAGDIYGQSVSVLKSKLHGIVEGIRAEIRRDQLIEIRCGEWMTTDEFSGITFYLDLDEDVLNLMAPSAYENGQKIYEFPTKRPRYPHLSQ